MIPGRAVQDECEHQRSREAQRETLTANNPALITEDLLWL